MNATHQPEQWKPVVGYESLYEVSDLGRVRSVDRRVPTSNGHYRRFRSKILNPYVRPNGYLIVSLSQDGKERAARVHALVLAAFVGPKPVDMECLHGNGIRDDNRIHNLRYGTRSDNMQDALKHGTHYFAKRTHCKNGHEYTPENTRLHKRNGSRVCRKCQQEYLREYSKTYIPKPRKPRARKRQLGIS